MSVVSNVSRLVPPKFLPFPPQVDNLSRTALFLDFDGTLVDIAPHPDAINVDPALPGLLTRLSERLSGRLAIVSGRSLADLDRHLPDADIMMAGSHGGEIRLGRNSAVTSLAAQVPEPIMEELEELATRHGGLLVEMKASSAAIHYRDNPDAGEAVLARTTALAEAVGLHIKHGKMVVEIASAGADKGNAVSHFMSLTGFADTQPTFIGDDTTDEDAFSAVVRHEGHGILVGPERETAARFRPSGVADVHAWLEEMLR